MSDIAIRVENLSKLYPAHSLRAGPAHSLRAGPAHSLRAGHIGARQERHDTLRDALVARFSRAGHSTDPQSTHSDDTDL